MLKQFFIASFIFGNIFLGFAQSGNAILDKHTITDDDIEVPEEIERNFDQLLVDWKKDLTAPVNCNPDLQNLLTYTDSIYINRLYSLPTEMELVYNPIVRSYIDMYLGSRKSSVGYFLGKSEYYFPIFEKYLDKYGLPLELKYLPIIESALNPTIVSRAGATGLWQFMIGTGKMYDLEINSLVDERRDPVKSSEAAARYLKDLYGIYNDWTLVIAAYNCGPGNVNKAIKKSGGESDYWTIYEYLPKETRGYVPAFIAAAYIMNYSADHNICPYEYKYTQSTDTIHIDKQLNMQQVADVLNLSMDELRNLNPQYKKDIIPGEFKEYVLKLPSIKATDFIASKDSIYFYKSNEYLAHRKVVEPKISNATFSAARTRYKVRKGDNLGSIAKKYNTTASQLKKWNGLKSNRLNVGQVLAVSNKPVAPKNVDKTELDTVLLAGNDKPKENDKSKQSTEMGSPSGLLGQYYAQVQKTNARIDDSEIEVEPLSATEIIDESSKVDDVSPVDNARDDLRTAQTIYHKVRIGETLTQISAKYNVNKKDLKSWNKINSSVPKVGQRLLIYLPPKKEDKKDAIPIITDDVTIKEIATGVNETKDVGDKQTSSIVSSVSTTPTKNNRDTKLPSRPTNTSIHKVKRGDTLGHIAGMYGGKMTPDQIKKANNLKSDKLSIGQKLKIPAI